MNQVYRNLAVWALIILAMFFLFNTFKTQNVEIEEISFSEFIRAVDSAKVKEITIKGQEITGNYTEADAGKKKMFRTYAPDDPDLVKTLRENNVKITAKPADDTPWYMSLLVSWLPILLLIGVWIFFMRQMQSGGGKAMSFGKSRAKLLTENTNKVTFTDVAGIEEAKEELQEIIAFLKDPKRFTKLGGRIPKGVLLVGLPGTGKTLLAKAIAGEAGVPFFSISGSDFVEMFVGVGAARVRDLFIQGKKSAPCLIFIDEIDAVGRHRGAGLGGGHDEREQTLNQLLVEMDGFDATSGLILLAATNRPDVLDPALLRPGRFDRQVLVDRPDLTGREAILRIHSKPVKLDPSVDLASVARSTSGFAGADLANIVNEAALLAVRSGRTQVLQKDFSEAIEKTVAGLQKKTRVISPEERRIVAFHETGHAMIAAFTPGSDPVQKISIVPRGFGALGYTLQMPVEDRYLMTEDDLLGKIDVFMGGRAAEELVFGKLSTGAANDLTKATDIARKMITDYGMSGRFRNIALTQRGAGMMGNSQPPEPMMHREYSEATQQYIDEEIARIVEQRYSSAKSKLEQGRQLLEKIAGILLEKETLDEKEFKALMKET